MALFQRPRCGGGNFDIFRKSQEVSARPFERKGAKNGIFGRGGHICPPPRGIGLKGMVNSSEEHGHCRIKFVSFTWHFLFCLQYLYFWCPVHSIGLCKLCIIVSKHELLKLLLDLASAISDPIGLVSSFKNLDLVANQSLAANSTYASKFRKSEIYKEKLAANFFGEPPKINRGT